MPGLTLACAAAHDRAKAQAWLDAQRIACPLVELDELPRMPTSRSNAHRPPCIERICRPMLEAGKTVMVLSCGALLERPALIALAKERGGQIIVPTGALLGLDAVTAAAEGSIHSVRMTTRKPPRGLAGAPYLEAQRDFGRRAQRGQAGVQRHGAGGGGRVPRQCQCGGGPVARRNRAGPDH